MTEKKQLAEEERANEPATKCGVDADTYGRVPLYLEAHKNDLAELKQAKMAALEEKKHPGLVLLPSEDRLQLLHEMETAHALKTAELQRLPIAVTTLRLRQRKAQLEQELDELERGIRRFNNKTVLVAKKG
eukprot:SAG31_NODE_4109_length_3573_cov_5.847726_3_plen_131_part_00